ncbi:MAG: TetR/AcrR family transcriptional regulator [Acidobacteriota bacterium]|nr:TetR/AcrR family transcriptional regulator [Acidobacteriota bacterium]
MDVSAKLVAEVGVDGVKTSEIARRAGITLASLYRYFPNKTAIFKRLVERMFEKLRPNLDNFLKEFDLDNGLDQLVDTYAGFYRSEPGYAQLWSGIQAIPELAELDMDDLHENARLIADGAQRMLPHIDRETLHAIAMVVARSTGAILRLELEETEMAADLQRELKLMLKSYLQMRLAPPA